MHLHNSGVSAFLFLQDKRTVPAEQPADTGQDMGVYSIIAILLTLSAGFAYINHKFLKLPMTIGLMLFSLLFSLSLILLDFSGLPVKDYASRLVEGIDFPGLLMEGMLGLLLFAGALHVNLNDLSRQKLEIGIFATFGVLFSTLLVGGFVYGISLLLGFHLKLIVCFLFGALISPTDPISVMGILKTAGAPRNLETKIAGESLFNDGIGVVIFLVILEAATTPGPLSYSHCLELLVKETIGGAVLGLLAGYAAYRLLKSINQYQVEVLITLALVFGGYTLAHFLHFSGPIAMVVAGLMIGNQGRRLAMSQTTREHIDTFWQLIDEILNAVLFVLIGLEALVLTMEPGFFLAGLLSIIAVVLSRFLSVSIPVLFLRTKRPFAPYAIRIMTWGGLRGGISVALALSLPQTLPRELILVMTYMVVVFSILVQGLTIRRLVLASLRR